MITAIIVDDEKHASNRLKNLILTYCKELTILAICSDIDTAYEQINLLKPDAVFLDIHIQNDISFDLLKKFKTIDFHIVFTTAYDKYAVQAFRFSAIDYLLKPIDSDDLKSSVKKLHKKTESYLIDNLNVVAQNMAHFRQQNKKITIPSLQGIEVINIQDIIHCQSDINYTTLYLKDAQITVAKTLKEFEIHLIPFNFYRIHNSHLINLYFVKSYHKGKGGYVELSNGKEIQVSQRRKEEFLKKLQEI